MAYRVHMTRYNATTKENDSCEIFIPNAAHVGDATDQAKKYAADHLQPGWIIPERGVRSADEWTADEEAMVLNNLDGALNAIAAALSTIHIQMPINKMMDMHLKDLDTAIENLQKIRAGAGSFLVSFFFEE